jgi:protein-arginine kinase activator protein McsA
MGQVNQLMEQIKSLNEEKIKHIHEENYNQAKVVKDEINKIKQQI